MKYEKATVEVVDFGVFRLFMTESSQKICKAYGVSYFDGVVTCYDVLENGTLAPILGENVYLHACYDVVPRPNSGNSIPCEGFSVKFNVPLE